MKTLEPILLVRELPPVCSSQRQHLPSLRDLATDTPGPQEAAALAYLGQGVGCGIYNDPGMLYDVLQPGRKIDFRSLPGIPDLPPQLILTDGTWVWPGAILYYLAVYHIRLPDRFLYHAERQQWTIDRSQIRPEELNWDAFDAVPLVAAQTR